MDNRTAGDLVHDAEQKVADLVHDAEDKVAELAHEADRGSSARTPAILLTGVTAVVGGVVLLVTAIALLVYWLV